MSAASKAVPITIGDQTYMLRFTNRAIVELEDRFDLTMIDAGEKLTRGSLKTIAALVWVGTRHENGSRPTFDQVVDAIDMSDPEPIGQALAAAMEAAFGKGPAEGKAEPAT